MQRSAAQQTAAAAGSRTLLAGGCGGLLVRRRGGGQQEGQGHGEDTARLHGRWINLRACGWRVAVCVDGIPANGLDRDPRGPEARRGPGCRLMRE